MDDTDPGDLTFTDPTITDPTISDPGLSLPAPTDPTLGNFNFDPTDPSIGDVNATPTDTPAPASDTGSGTTVAGSLQTASAGASLFAAISKLLGGSSTSGSSGSKAAPVGSAVGSIGTPSLIPGVNNEILIAGGLAVGAIILGFVLLRPKA